MSINVFDFFRYCNFSIFLKRNLDQEAIAKLGSGFRKNAWITIWFQVLTLVLPMVIIFF